MNLKKDLLLEKLTKEINDKTLLLERFPNNTTKNLNVGNGSDSERKGQNKLLFKEYEAKIHEKDLCQLRSFSDAKQKDSSFVLACLDILYRENLSILHERNAKLSTATKRELTPEKKIYFQVFFLRE